jgi:hypothetical protein
LADARDFSDFMCGIVTNGAQRARIDDFTLTHPAEPDRLEGDETGRRCGQTDEHPNR